MNENQLTSINRFTRRNFTEDEIYVFDVILCDNETDRDNERFSHKALLSLKELFVGKTGITDHNPLSDNQLARIFDTELIRDESRITSFGEPYEYLKASVYMVRTDSNKCLIAEIDGGIKKEVSISCCVSEKICSVCGCSKSEKSCGHISGRKISGRICHTILNDVTDAYEWSFVAVPAQRNAGVTKHFTDDSHKKYSSDSVSSEAAENEIRSDIIRLAFLCGDEKSAAEISSLSVSELIEIKHKLESKKQFFGSQLLECEADDNSDFELH